MANSIYLVILSALAFGIGLSLYYGFLCRKAMDRLKRGGRC